MSAAGNCKARARDLVFYDGTCGLCHASVRFLLNRDADGSRFVFAPIGGEAFRETFDPPASVTTGMDRQEREALPDSVIVLTADQRTLIKSVAVIHVLARLDRPWPTVARLLRLKPRVLRDAYYDLMARTRRTLFERPDDWCPVVPEELRARFRR